MPPKEEPWTAEFEQLHATPLDEIDPAQARAVLDRFLVRPDNHVQVEVARFNSSI